MPFLRQLVLRLLGALLAPLALAWYVAAAFFPFTQAQRLTVEVILGVALVLLPLLGTAAVGRFAAAIRRGLEAPAGSAEAPRLRQQAAAMALRLPARVSGVLLLLAMALVLASVLGELRQDLPGDLTLAVLAAGSAIALMVSMLGYSVAATLIAPTIARLGSVEVGGHGTLRSKVLVVCCGLVAFTALLLGAVGYATSRADADRRHLDRAARMQEEAARWAGPRGAAAAAELVWVATGAPTALYAADGAVVASAGEIDGAAPGGAGSSPAVERLPGGWRLRRAAGPLTMVSDLPEARLRDRRDGFLVSAAVLALALLCSAGLLVWLVARSLTLPLAVLGEAAHRFAGGDLTALPPSLSRDEMGQLAADFRRMAQGLAALVMDVRAASRSVGEGTLEMDAIGEKVKGGAREERERMLAVQAAVEAMQGQVAMVGRGVGGLADHVHSTSSAVGEMAAALEELLRQASELERRLQAATGDAERLAGAGRKAQTQLGALEALAGRAQGTLATVSASLSGLETAAISSQLAAAQAAEIAEHAGAVVKENVDGMASLRGAVADAKKKVTALGRRSDDIDQVLDFISEVAGRTNLLSLNASIIATQAGEHGRAFGVVADQIRELAAQIASSTKSIGEILGAVRDDVAGTARLIDRGDELSSAGLAHARNSLDALGQIRVATARGHETAAVIRDAVLTHARSTGDVSNLVATVAENSRALAEALELVGRSVEAVGAVSRGAGTLADKVSQALEEQSGLGRRQLESLEKIDGMISDITRAVENHGAATRRVREGLGRLGQTAERQEEALVELSSVAQRLGVRSRELEDRVGRFRIEPHAAEAPPE